MRLINTATGEFEEFFDLKTTPPYAILSHTWDGKEQTYQEVLEIQKQYSFQGVRYQLGLLVVSHPTTYANTDLRSFFSLLPLPILYGAPTPGCRRRFREHAISRAVTGTATSGSTPPASTSPAAPNCLRRSTRCSTGTRALIPATPSSGTSPQTQM